jgi:hypothetical protein
LITHRKVAAKEASGSKADLLWQHHAQFAESLKRGRFFVAEQEIVPEPFTPATEQRVGAKGVCMFALKPSPRGG